MGRDFFARQLSFHTKGVSIETSTSRATCPGEPRGRPGGVLGLHAGSATGCPSGWCSHARERGASGRCYSRAGGHYRPGKRSSSPTPIRSRPKTPTLTEAASTSILTRTSTLSTTRCSRSSLATRRIQRHWWPSPTPASPDAKIYTFKLRKDVKFSDGTPLKAADVAFSYNRLLNLHDTPVYLLDGVTGVEAPDDYTFVLTSKDPNPAIPFIVTNPALGVINSTVIKAHGGSDQPGADKTDTAEDYFQTAPPAADRTSCRQCRPRRWISRRTRTTGGRTSRTTRLWSIAAWRRRRSSSRSRRPQMRWC